MKILHYALGFPPYRSGGLTKLCVDLMVQQAKEGHSVAMLWPGQMGFVNKKISIKKHENVKLRGLDILSFEIINPLPVSFDEGMRKLSEADVRKLLEENGIGTDVQIKQSECTYRIR